MASPSTRTSTLPTGRSNSIRTSSSKFDIMSAFLFFSTTPSKPNRRLCFSTLSFDPIIPSSSCSRRKYVQSATRDGPCTDVRGDEKVMTEIATDHHVEKAEKLVAGKRPFWQRILFASKKMRSIFLLNVITIVYASDISFVKAVEATMDPAAFYAVRFIMSAIPFLPFVIRARHDKQTRNAGIELVFWVSLRYPAEDCLLLMPGVHHLSPCLH